VTANPETGQTLVSGMGELHLEIVMGRLKNDMNVDVLIGKPRVSYRETVRRKAEGVGEFDRQIGGKRHFARVRVEIKPSEDNQPTGAPKIINRLSFEAMPAEYSQAVERGIADAAQSGILGGYPVINWQAAIITGQLHETDSSEVSFEAAGRSAFYSAMKEADPVLLEPIMAVEVVTVDEHFGAIMTDLSTRGATVRETSMRGTNRVIAADVPLSQMFGYVTRLRSLSQGRATASMTPSHYAAVSAAEMKTLVG